MSLKIWKDISPVIFFRKVMGVCLMIAILANLGQLTRDIFRSRY